MNSVLVSLSEENYLKIIYSLEKEPQNSVSTSALAKKLNAKAASVSEMVQKLAAKDLLIYKKYYGVYLTPKGKKIALKVIRKHRLWETFLAEKLNFSWDEIHELAEQLEHIKSDKLTNALDQFLGFPALDPHGDPIPTYIGCIRQVPRIALADCSVQSKGKIVGVEDSSSKFLQYLDKNNIGLGTEFVLLKRNKIDESIDLQIRGNTIHLNAKMASNLFVKIINDKTA